MARPRSEPRHPSLPRRYDPQRDGYGVVGSDINLLFSMLAAQPFKRALAGSGHRAGHDGVYRSLVCRYPSLVSPDAFQLEAEQPVRHALLVIEPGVSKTSSPSGSRTVTRVTGPRGVG